MKELFFETSCLSLYGIFEINIVTFFCKNGKSQTGPEDFLTGWMLGEDKKEVWGRPVGLLQLADGSLLVSDDGAGKLWRISYTTLPE